MLFFLYIVNLYITMKSQENVSTFLKKTKKLFAVLGVILAFSTMMLAGCSVTADVSRGDNTTQGSTTTGGTTTGGQTTQYSDAYLEYAKNNDSEFVKNRLNELLIICLNASEYQTNFSYTNTTKNYAEDMIYATSETTVKITVDNGVKKIYLSYDDEENCEDYYEISKTTDGKYNIVSYKHRNDNKTKETKENQDKVEYSRSLSFYSYYDLLSNIFMSINEVFSDYHTGSFTRSVDNGVETIKCWGINHITDSSEPSTDYYILSSLTLKFENNKLISVDNVLLDYPQSGVSYSSVVFNYDTPTIDFDKTGYTEQE